ncbi:MAG: hypothetical protein ACFFB5_14045 [Promethearchaeota archaeon]
MFKPPPTLFFDSDITIKRRNELMTIEWGNLRLLSIYMVNPHKAPGLYSMLASGKITINIRLLQKDRESKKFQISNIEAKKVGDVIKLISERMQLEPQVLEGKEALQAHSLEYFGKKGLGWHLR